MTPGSAMAVLRDGAIVATRVHGPVTLETNFRLASLTKQFTAAAAAVLVRRGLLDYDAPDARGITIRHLLNHTSGWPTTKTSSRRSAPNRCTTTKWCR